MITVLDPMDLPDEVDLDELEAALLRRGSKVFREYFVDERPERWGLRLVDPADEAFVTAYITRCSG